MQTPNERTVHCNWSQSKPWGNMDNRIFDKFERNFTNYTGILTCSSYDTVLDGIIRPCIIRPPFRPSTSSLTERHKHEEQRHISMTQRNTNTWESFVCLMEISRVSPDSLSLSLPHGFI